ncbi:MAG: LamG domain-containing protein, partial [Candidatus Brocadia sp.]
GATWTTGQSGNALNFDGVNDYVSIPLINNDEVSICAWFLKNANDSTSADAIFGGWNWNSNTQRAEGFDLRFYQGTPNILDFIVVTQNSSGIRTFNRATYAFSNSVDNWHHVVGTYNKATGEQRLYVNGQHVSTVNHPAGNTIVPLTAYSDMRIGYSRVNNGYFFGIIDDVRLYNRSLSNQEVQDIFNNP